MIDLNSASPQAVRALNRLKELGNEALVELFEAELEAAKQKLVYAGDTVAIHRLQGRAEAFESLLRAIEESAKVMNRA
jgi:hypothetical protein